MKTGYIVLLVGLLGACSFHSMPVMTSENFHKTHVGMSEEMLVKTYGTPLTVYHKDNGEVVYEYIERFQMGAGDGSIAESRRYYFTIKDHKIIHKQMVISNQPAYESMDQFNL